MPIYPYSFTMPPVNKQDIPSDGVVGEFLGISAGGVLDWLPVAGGSGTGDLLAANNLSELTPTAGTARTNLGLGTGDSPTFANLTLTSPSLSSSAPVTISQTWNGTVSTVFTALKVNAVSTVSSTSSYLLDLQVGGVSQFSVQRNGTLRMTSTDVETKLSYSAAGFLFFGSGAPSLFIGQDGTGNGNAVMGNTGFIGFSSAFTAASGNADTRLYRDSASGNTLALRNGANTQTFNVYGSYGSISDYKRLSISCDQTTGNATITNQAAGYTAGTVSIGNAQKVIVGAPNNVALAFLSADINNVAFRPSGTTLEIVRGDAGAFANLKANDLTLNGSLIVSNTPITSNSNIAGTNIEATSLIVTTTSNGTTAAGFGTRLLYRTETDTNVLQDSGAISSVWSNAVNANRTSDMLFYNVLNGTLTERMRILGASGNVGIGTTSPTSKLHVAETWNAASTTFTAVNVNVTDTASAAASKLLDLQVGGVSKASFNKDGVLAMGGGTMADGGNGFLFKGGGVPSFYVGQNGSGVAAVAVASGGAIGFSSLGTPTGGSLDTILIREAGGNHLALRNAAIGQTFSVYGTYPGAAWERFTITAPTSGNVLLGTYKGTGGIARGLEFQTDGVTRMTLSADGVTASISPTNLNTGSQIRVGGMTRITNSSDGVLKITDSSEGSFNRLQLGGTSASFPAIKRVGTDLQIVVSNTSAATNVAAGDADLTFIEDRYRRKGAGTPEGVVTAPIGAVYHNTTGGAGTSFYVKESGTGNTGWVGK